MLLRVHRVSVTQSLPQRHDAGRKQWRGAGTRSVTPHLRQEPVGSSVWGTGRAGRRRRKVTRLQAPALAVVALLPLILLTPECLVYEGVNKEHLLF